MLLYEKTENNRKEAEDGTFLKISPHHFRTFWSAEADLVVDGEVQPLPDVSLVVCAQCINNATDYHDRLEGFQSA